MKKRLPKKIARVRKITTKYKKIIFGVSLFSIIIITGLFFTISESRRDANNERSASSSIAAVYPTVQPISTNNWKTYSNRVYGFTIQYPPEYSLSCYDCEQVDDDVEWATSHITFTPAEPLGKENIVISLETDLSSQPIKPNESIQDYLRRIFPSSNDQIIESLIKETKVGEYNALQVVYESGYDIYGVKNYFLYQDMLISIMFSDTMSVGKMQKPIYEYPNIGVYHQMLKTFKPADLPQTRKITSLYKPSLDGSFYVRTKEAGHGEHIILINNKGENITMQSFFTNRELFQPIRCYECGIRFGRWINNYQFAVRLVGAFMNDDDTMRSGEYEYVIDARNGEIVPNSLKQIK